jgi:hypothetical protein
MVECPVFSLQFTIVVKTTSPVLVPVLPVRQVRPVLPVRPVRPVRPVLPVLPVRQVPVLASLPLLPVSALLPFCNQLPQMIMIRRKAGIEK